MSIVRIRGTDGNFKGIPSFKGDTGAQGVSVTGSSIDASGHLILTLSDGSTVDAGALPSAVSSVNGKTGTVTLDAADVGAPSDTDFAAASKAIGYGSLLSKNASLMFGTSGTDIDIGITSAQPVYICIAADSGLDAGSTITATPYWGGTAMQSQYAATGMQLGRWYKIGHPMLGSSVTLPKINLKTDTGNMMSATSVINIKYVSGSSTVNDIDTISGVLSCDAIAHETLSGLSTTKTAVLFNSSVSSKYEAYVCITPQSALPSGSTITVTPVYGAVEYSDGAVSGVKANEWVKLNRPQSTVGSNLMTMVGLTLSSGSYTGSVNVAIRYISTTTT